MEKDIAYAKLQSLNADLEYLEQKATRELRNLLRQIEIDLLKVQIKYIKKHYNL